MKAHGLSLALAAAGVVALTLAWPDTPAAQTKAPTKAPGTVKMAPVASPKPQRCYRPSQMAAKTTPMAKLPPPGLCLGVISGKNCIACPGHPGSQVIQVVVGKTVSCLRACGKGFVWNAKSRQCCPGTPPPPPVIK